MVHTDDSAVERVELDQLRSYLDQERVVFAILFGSHHAALLAQTQTWTSHSGS